MCGWDSCASRLISRRKRCAVMRGQQLRVQDLEGHRASRAVARREDPGRAAVRDLPLDLVAVAERRRGPSAAGRGDGPSR